MPVMDARSNGRLPIGQGPAQAEGGRASDAIAEARKNIAEDRLRDSSLMASQAGSAGHSAGPGPAAAGAKLKPTADTYEAKQNSFFRSAVKKFFDRL